MTEFTASEKHAAVVRELKMRRKVYPHWISVGKIDVHEAQRQIELMQAIASDYEKLAQAERLL